MQLETKASRECLKSGYLLVFEAIHASDKFLIDNGHRDTEE